MFWDLKVLFNPLGANHVFLHCRLVIIHESSLLRDHVMYNYAKFLF